MSRETLKTVVFSEITGMTCPACAVRIQAAVRSIAGVNSCQISFGNRSAVVIYDSTVVAPQTFGNAITKLGYSFCDPPLHELEQLVCVEVEGMSCGGCAARVQTVLSARPDVAEAQVSFETKTASVMTAANEETIISAIQNLGYTCRKKNICCEGRAPTALYFRVENITCGGCIDIIETELAKMEGVNEVVANLNTKLVRVVGTISAMELVRSLDDLGYSAVGVDISSQNSTLFLEVEGMVCMSCAQKVEKTIRAQKGVTKVEVSLQGKSALVAFDSNVVEASAILHRARTSGFKVELKQPTSSGLHLRYIIEGMSCAACAARIEKTLRSSPGILLCSVNFSSNSCDVTLDNSGLNCEESVAKQIEEMGYKCKFLNEENSEAREDTKQALERTKEIASQKNLFIGSLFASVPLFGLMLFRMFAGGSFNFVMQDSLTKTVLIVSQFLLASTGVFFFGNQFFIRAWMALKHFTFTMDSLIATGCGSAYLYSIIAGVLIVARNDEFDLYFDTVGMLLTFMLLGKFLEALAKRQTSASLISLLSLAPTNAIMVTNSGDVEVPASSIVCGNFVRVLPGATIPVDGSVTEGNAWIDDQLVTGESIPKTKAPGDRVVGGSFCVGGDIVVKAEKVGSETMLCQILRIVQEAQSSKPAIQRIADKVAGVFAQFVLGLACCTLLVWLVLGASDSYPAHWRGDKSFFIFAFSLAIATVVAACPCALGLATPTAVMVGTGIGAKLGILVKGGAILEQAKKVTCIIFDKTGTLTKGNLVVANAIPQLLEANTDLIRRLIGTVESRSTHPIAKAITSHFGTLDSSEFRELFVQTLPGFGVTAEMTEVNGSKMKVIIGSSNHLQQCGVAVGGTAQLTIASVASDGFTPVLVGIGTELVYILGLADQLKEEATEVVSMLKQSHRIMMLTGDNETVARHIAKEVGIPLDCVTANVLPGDKALIVQQQQKKGDVVAFVGDGLNDAPALTQADVGIALGAGTEVAIEAADAVLIHNSLWDIINFMFLSRATVRRIYFNFGWALVYNVIMLPIACGLLVPFGVTLPPVVAGAAMVCSSVSVLGSSLALNFFSPHSAAHTLAEVKATPETEEQGLLNEDK